MWHFLVVLVFYWDLGYVPVSLLKSHTMSLRFLHIFWYFPRIAMSVFSLSRHTNIFSVLVTSKWHTLIHIIYIALLIWWNTLWTVAKTCHNIVSLSFIKDAFSWLSTLERSQKAVNWLIHSRGHIHDVPLHFIWAQARKLDVHLYEFLSICCTVDNCLRTEGIQSLPFWWEHTA